MVVSLVWKVTSPLLPHYHGGTTFGRAANRDLIASMRDVLADA
jgi:hypothetical protein